MAYKTLTSKLDVIAVDIQTMADMSMEDYREYIRTGLVTIDHHDVLRSAPAGYPLAVTKAQCNALIAYLKEISQKVGA